MAMAVGVAKNTMKTFGWCVGECDKQCFNVTKNGALATSHLKSVGVFDVRRQIESRAARLRSHSLTSLASDSGSSGIGSIEDGLTEFVLDERKSFSVVHKVWEGIVRPGDTVIDATCGNGYDTLMLAKLVYGEGTPGLVLGLDLQETAIESTRTLLDKELLPHQRQQVKLFKLCHSNLDKVAPDSSVRLVAFNLGYQPGGDKRITTKATTSVQALTAAVKVIESGGLISIMAYVAHPGGWDEYNAVKHFAADMPKNDWVCSHHEWINGPFGPKTMFFLRK